MTTSRSKPKSKSKSKSRSPKSRPSKSSSSKSKARSPKSKSRSSKSKAQPRPKPRSSRRRAAAAPRGTGARLAPLAGVAATGVVPATERVETGGVAATGGGTATEVVTQPAAATGVAHGTGDRVLGEIRVAATEVVTTQATAATGVAHGPGDRVLGEIRVPSGKLAIFDIGLMGYLPRAALEPAIVTCPVPPDRALPVTGTLVGRGRFADCWDHVAIPIGDGEIVGARKLGEVGVDFARLACIDHAALDAWQHEDSLDGRADVVFWGRDDRLLARAIGAPRSAEGYGWVDLPLAEAEAKLDAIARVKSEHRWLVAIDFRPHSHHYYALAAARASRQGVGTLDVGGTRMMLLFTSWGDGVFPIYVDVDVEGRPVQVRIQLATAAASAVAATSSRA